MTYIERDENNEIVAVHKYRSEKAQEIADYQNPEVMNFISPAQSLERLHEQLQEMDAAMIRVIEDIVDVLVSKNLIQITDLPLAVIEKIKKKQGVREQYINLSSG